MARSRRLRLLVGVATLSFVFYKFFPSLWGYRGYDTWTEEPALNFELRSSGTPCAAYPQNAFQSVQVVLKVGAAEVDTKLPIHLRTVSGCIPDLLIFSDFEEDASDHHIYDALAKLPATYRSQQPDFQIYEDIKIQRLANQTMDKNHDGWKLDRYKFLPMMEQIWELRDQKQWYLFIELDTYVVWDNLLRWLRHFNSDEWLYMGSPVWPPNKPTFAHGGSGFILSRGALQNLFYHGHKFTDNSARSAGTHQFGQNLTGECCGDEVLAKVLKDMGITLSGYWPMINGENPSTVRFGHEQWCEPIVTMHHLSERDLNDLSTFEVERKKPQNPLTFEELYTYIEPSLAQRKPNWVNTCEDVKLHGQDVQSADRCEEACTEDANCFQWLHFGNTCQLAYTFNLGHEQEPDHEKGIIWTSGWDLKRIDQFKLRYSPCKRAHWVHSNP